MENCNLFKYLFFYSPNYIIYFMPFCVVKEKFGISPDHTIYLADETGTEVDEDVFADIMEQKPDTLWTIVDSMATEGLQGCKCKYVCFK